MAGYGINQQGVENLQKLASDLHHFNDNFEEAGRALRQRVADVSDELGVYEDEIIEIIYGIAVPTVMVSISNPCICHGINQIRFHKSHIGAMISM